MGLDSARGRDLGDVEVEARSGGENSHLCHSSEQIFCVLQSTWDGQSIGDMESQRSDVSHSWCYPVLFTLGKCPSSWSLSLPICKTGVMAAFGIITSRGTFLDTYPAS